jgi:hypothetical protein
MPPDHPRACRSPSDTGPAAKLTAGWPIRTGSSSSSSPRGQTVGFLGVEDDQVETVPPRRAGERG